MKRHLTLASGHRLAAIGRNVHPAQSASHGRPAGTLLWRHTLILEGRLDECSRPELEDEVECLYQEGVTSLSLDLRRLQEVDDAGVQALASMGTHWRQRGQGLDVIADPDAVGGALAQAGAQDLLASEGLDAWPVGAGGPSLRGSLPSRSTSMVKGLT